ncbi:restriction endonuclease [Streptomyces luteolifulvus]|jgi:hypothetical protein|nr:restriction endonuclease [Streptomyces luteolifulvus]
MQPMQISSWQQAELNAARWMRHWGYADATARPGGPDSGVDVRAAGALGQVKYQAAQVGRPELQRFVGARPRGSNAQLIFFTGSDYAPTAVAYAEEWSIALFKYGLDGMMTPVNAPARRISRPSPSTSPSPSPSPSAAAAASDASGESFWKRNWRVVAGVSLLLAPFGSIGDEKTYTGPLALDVLKFIGILLACWLVGTFLLATRFGFRTGPIGSGSAARADRGRTRPAAPAPTPASDSPDALVSEAARLLRSGRRQHQVDAVLRERGVTFMARGRILNEAKSLNKRTRDARPHGRAPRR